MTAAGLMLVPSLGVARDFGLLVPTIHQGKFTSSLLYEHLKVSEDFNIRGEADFKSQIRIAHFEYAAILRDGCCAAS